LATHNSGKLGELRKLVADWDCEVLSVGELGAAAPDETSDTFAGNALLKARAAADQFDAVALGDDGGLVVPELGGVPGVHSSRWVAQQGGWIAARERLIFEAGLCDASFRRVEAILHCALAYATPEGNEASAESTIVGQLRAPLSEDHEDYGPGFLPVFEADDPGLWIDEVLVHRRRAFAQLEAGLRAALSY
jgi:XTP/dITP diphosphohydrolase